MNAHFDPLATILLDRYQHDFPLEVRPFAVIGKDVGLGEGETIARYRAMKEQGLITRIGAIVAPNAIGASTLAAISIPAGELEAAAAVISAEPFVTHNYERENALNLWFVVAAPGAADLDETLARIETNTGTAVFDLRLEEAFHLDLGFSVDNPFSHERRKCLAAPDLSRIRPGDKAILAAIEDGLSFTARPYAEAAAGLGIGEAGLVERLRELGAACVIRRFGVVVRHRAVGIGANAMTVWDVNDAEVGRIGKLLAHQPGVNLCYRRRRDRDWRYNLYCMVHGRTRDEALEAVARLDRMVGSAARAREILFSSRCFKQTGARFKPAGKAS